MKSLARLIVLIVLAVSLPFHAAYGAGVAQCMAFGMVHAAPKHESASALSHAASGHQTHPVDGLDAAAHQHPAGAGVHGDAGQGIGTAEGGGAHCGTSTACCTSVGMTAASQAMPSHDGFEAMVPIPEHPLSSITSGRLERPPLAA